MKYFHVMILYSVLIIKFFQTDWLLKELFCCNSKWNTEAEENVQAPLNQFKS